MDKKEETIKAYNQSAKTMADKFDNIGARISDIDEIFKLLNKDNPKVLEIGCGNGRDAEEILKRTNDYLGIDISEEMIKLAQEKVSQGRFQVADIYEFDFPNSLDAIFAFASLLHLNKEELASIFKKIYDSLNPLGLFRLSLKYKERYQELIKTDNFGVRVFYFYSDKDIVAISDQFKILKKEIIELKGQKWLEMILQKPE